MTDPFTSGGDSGGAGEAANEGFKIFGMSVSQFAATVAAVDAIGENLTDRIEQAILNAAKTQKKSSAATDKFAGAAEQQRKNVKEQGTHIKELAKHARSSAAASQDTAITMRHLRIGFKKWFRDQKKAWDKRLNTPINSPAGVQSFNSMFGSLLNSFKGVGGLLKSFLLKFIPIVSVLSFLTRVLESFVEALDASRLSTRPLGIDFSENRFRGILQGTNPAIQNRFGLANVNVTGKETVDILKSINEGLENSARLTSDLVASTWTVSRAFNASSDEVGKFYGVLTRAQKLSTEQIDDIFGIAASGAEALGLNIETIGQQIAEWPGAAFQFATNMREGRQQLVRAYLEAELLGTSFKQARDFADTLFDPSVMTQRAVGARMAGLNISMQDLARGAFENPSGLIEKYVTQIRKQYGSLKSSGADRFTLRSLLETTGLGAMGFDEAGLAKAIAAVDPETGRLKDLDNIMEQAMKTPMEDLRDRLGEFVGKGMTLEERLEQLADSLVSKLVRSNIGLWLMNTTNGVLKLANITPQGIAENVSKTWMGSLGRKVGASFDRGALLGSYMDYIEGHRAAGTGMFDDNRINLSEIAQLVQRSVNSGAVAAEDRDNMILALFERIDREGIKVTSEDIGSPQMLVVTDTAKRRIMEGRIENPTGKVKAP